MTTIHDALQRAVDNTPGGRRVLSVRLGKTDEVLRKELSGAQSHKLGALDALAIARLACEAGTPHCYDYAAHVAEECGGEFRPKRATRTDDQNPVQRVTDVYREASDVACAVIEGMVDGAISDNELARIEREAAEAHEAIRRTVEAARAVNLAGKPASERGLIELPVVDAIRSQEAA